MPALDKYDAVHPDTVAGEFYGCKDRAPFRKTYLVPNGNSFVSRAEDGTRLVLIKLTPVPNRFEQNCVPPDGPAAARCGNCKWRTNNA